MRNYLDKIKVKTKSLLKNIIGLGLGNNLSFKLLRTIGKNHLIILYYHRVACKEDLRDIRLSDLCVDIDSFDAQMSVLSKFYNFVSEEDIIETIENGKKLPEYSVWITFDDGFSDNYTNACPILKKYEIPAIIFITTGYINKRVNPYRNINNLFMSWEEITELGKNGISIGAHTVNHKILSSLTKEEIEIEISESKNEIETRLGKKVFSFAYPVGRNQHYHSEKCIPVLQENGFKLAVTTIGGFNNIKRYGVYFNLRRMGISYEDTLNFFRLKVALGSFWQR